MSSIFDFKACIYNFLLLLPVYSFGLAKNFLFGWKRIVGILVGGIRILGTAWGDITVGAVYEDITVLEVALELESVVGFTIIKHSDKHF